MKITNLESMIMELENVHSLKREDIEKIQLKKLNEVLKKEHERQGFYKHLPERLSDLKELENLPFTTAEDLRENSASMLLLSQSRVERVLTEQSSGTTGEPKRLYYTAGDLENTVRLFMAGLGEFVFSGSVTYIAMPFSGPNGLGELIAEAIERLGAKPIKAGPFLSVGEIREVFEREKPDTYVGMPGNLLFILRTLGKMSLERALVSGDASPKCVEKSCEEILRTRLFPHYGSREMALGGAVTCPAHEGMHLRENHVIAEIVDEKGNTVPQGEWGELVITTIGMEAMPLIRYKTGDYTRILPYNCPCGSEILRLDELKRMEYPDIFRLEETLFSLPQICDFITERKDDEISLKCLVNDHIQIKEIEHSAQNAMPNVKFNVEILSVDDATKPLCPGKRKIEQESSRS